MFGVGVWQCPRGVEVVCEYSLGLFDGPCSVLIWDFCEGWELGSGAEMAAQGVTKDRE